MRRRTRGVPGGVTGDRREKGQGRAAARGRRAGKRRKETGTRRRAGRWRNKSKASHRTRDPLVHQNRYME